MSFEEMFHVDRTLPRVLEDLFMFVLDGIVSVLVYEFRIVFNYF